MQQLPELKDQLNSKDLFDAFKAQLGKNLEQSNLPADFVATLEPSYNLICEKIAFELQRSYSNTDFTIMPLLNRIDISEAQLKRYINENKSEPYFTVLAELIIKRVLQKVVIKQYYKNKESK